MNEMLDFNRAVKAAIDFAEHDGKTLVIVTADHETGGMTIESDGIIGWTSYGGHTGVPVPVYAFGTNASFFSGNYDNTGIFHKLAKAMKLKTLP